MKKSILLSLLWTIIFIYCYSQNIFYICFIIVPSLIIYYNKIKIKFIIFSIFICLIPILIYIFLYNWIIIKNLGIPFFKNSIVNFLKNNYSTKTSAIIGMVCFSSKINSFAWKLYYQSDSLSIIYLFSIGGLQISFLKLVIEKILKKRKIYNIINFIIILSYGLTLSFAAGITRVLICFIIRTLFRKKIKNTYEVLIISAFITVLIQPSIVLDFGFCMSYICTFYVLWIVSFNMKSIFYEQMLINVGCTFLCIPFVSMMNGVVSLNSILFSIAMNYIFMFLYIWYFFTFYLTFLKPIHDFFANSVIFLITNLLVVNYSILINELNHVSITLFYLTSFLFFYIIRNKYIIKSNEENRIIYR